MISLKWQDFVDKGMNYYDAVIQANALPNQKVRDTWRECISMVKLTAFHTQECARATRECADYTEIVATLADKQIHKQLNKILRETANYLAL